MKKLAPIREQLIANLFKKFGKKPFRFTDLQREIVEMHGLNYDEMEMTYNWRTGEYDRLVRKYRGWYCDVLYPNGYYYKNSEYLYARNENGLKLVHIARGKYKLV